MEVVDSTVPDCAAPRGVPWALAVISVHNARMKAAAHPNCHVWAADLWAANLAAAVTPLSSGTSLHPTRTLPVTTSPAEYAALSVATVTYEPSVICLQERGDGGVGALRKPTRPMEGRVAVQCAVSESCSRVPGRVGGGLTLSTVLTKASAISPKKDIVTD
jgi:hypothetical protein